MRQFLLFQRRMRAGLLTMLLALLFGARAIANDVAFEKTIRDISVEKDGTFTQINTVLARINSEAGAKGLGQVPIPYSESLQALEVLEAYTLKPDGTRVDVKKDAIFTQAAPVAVSAPMFNDIKFRIIVFPEPAMGGKIYFKVRVRQTTPFFPGHVSFVEALPSTLAQELTEIRLSAPNDYPLNVDVRGFTGGEVASEVSGRKQWVWTNKVPSARKPEPLEVAETDFGAYVAVSSFADWAELGRAYLARADAKAQASGATRKLATDIVVGAKDRRDEVRLIYDWAKRQIRYVGVFLGLGGFVPRDVLQIIDTKYGDCKDVTTLIVALLRSRGINATTALVNSLNTYRLPSVAAVGAFNHAIVYVPEFDLYLDGTSEFSRVDSLPPSVAGKPVLLTATGKLATTPAASATQDFVKNTVALVLKNDGSFSGKTSVVTGGAFETNTRAATAAIPAGQEEKAATAWIRRAGPQSTAKVKTSDPRNFNAPFSMEVDFEVKDTLSLESPGAFRIPSGVTQHPISALGAGSNQVGARATPFTCGSDRREEEITLTLPDKVQVASLPKDVNFEGATTRYRAIYSQMGNVIRVTRVLSRERQQMWCGADMWAETEQLAAAIARDHRAQVVLK